MTKKKKVIGVAGLAAVALIGGTFAYFSQQTTIDNPFNTARYGTIVTEDFNPEDGEKWEPGANVNKDLYVDNTGDREIVVRVKFEDHWKRDNIEFKVATGSNAKEVAQDDPKDGLVEKDKSVVHKNFASDWETKWTFNPEDGYYYYNQKLTGQGTDGASTGLFLDSVTLDKDTDMGAIGTQYYFAIGPKGQKPTFNAAGTIATSSNVNSGTWVKVGEIQNKDSGTWQVKSIKELKELNASAVNNYPGINDMLDEKGELKPNYSIYTAALTEPADGQRLGYSGADYTLSITVETVQATIDAVNDVFGTTVPSDVKAGWQLEEVTGGSTTGGDSSGETPAGDGN